MPVVRMGTGFRRATVLVAALAGSVAVGGYPAAPAGATVSPEEPAPSSFTRLAGTWGACGSWWTETATESSSGSVCGVDGVVMENGELKQLTEPVISVSRYVCVKQRRAARSITQPCRSENFEGTVRRTEMTVDPFLRRATIRGTLRHTGMGGCALDVEYIGVGAPEPQGNLSEWHGGTPNSPSVSVSGAQTYTSQAGWWGSVCGELVVPPPDEDSRQAWIFRGAEASLSRGNAGHEGC